MIGMMFVTMSLAADLTVLRLVITDEGGLAIPGVEVYRLEEKEKPLLLGIADENGRVLLEYVEAPSTLRAEKPGFMPTQIPIVETEGKEVHMLVEMPLEGRGCSIYVCGAIHPTMDVESTMRGAILSREFLERIP